MLKNNKEIIIKSVVLFTVHTHVRMSRRKHRCYFPSAVDRKISKCEAIFCPPRTEKEEHAHAIFRLWYADGNLCAQSVIFRP